MKSENPLENLTTLDANDLDIGAVLRNIHTDELVVVTDKKTIIDEPNSMINGVLYRLRREKELTVFDLSEEEIEKLYVFVTREEGTTRYYIHYFNHDNNKFKDERVEEGKMKKKIEVNVLDQGTELVVILGGELKGVTLVAGEKVVVRNLYADGEIVSVNLPIGKERKTIAFGARDLNKFFDLVNYTQAQVEFDIEAKETITPTIEDKELEESSRLTGVKKIKENKKRKDTNILIPSCHDDVVEAFTNGATTIVIIRGGFKGIATCHEEDVFDRLVGYKIAYAKASIKKETRGFKEFIAYVNSNIKDLNDLARATTAKHNKALKRCQHFLKNAKNDIINK